MAVTRVNNFAAADAAPGTSVAATYTTANLTASNFMAAWVFVGVATSFSSTPSTTAVSATGGINFSKIYDGGNPTVGGVAFSASLWVAPVGAAAGTKPTVTATVANASSSSGMAIGIEELHESTGASTLAVDGTPAAPSAASGGSVTTPAYISASSSELLFAWYTDDGSNVTVSNNGTGYTADSHVSNGNEELVLLTKAAAGGSETAVTFTLASGTAQLVAGMLAVKAGVLFAPPSPTVVGQGSTPTASTGLAYAPTVTQAIRRGGYY